MTEIEYEISRPDPDAADIRERRQGLIRGLVEDIEVCTCFFGHGYRADELALTQIETDPAYQGRGYAEGMIDLLIREFPGYRLVDGGGDNTDDGDGFLRAMRAKRKVQ